MLLNKHGYDMFRFKKLLIVMVAVLLAATFTGCVAPTQPVTELSTSSEAKNPPMSGYSNDFEGLVGYMRDSELISGDGLDMSADFIGAMQGQKFGYSYKGAHMTCELYEFDIDNLGDKGKEVLDSIKATGTFKSLDNDVEASISDNGRFVMIFVSSAKDENVLPFIDRINEKFKTFNGK